MTNKWEKVKNLLNLQKIENETMNQNKGEIFQKWKSLTDQYQQLKDEKAEIERQKNEENQAIKSKWETVKKQLISQKEENANISTNLEELSLKWKNLLNMNNMLKQ